MFIKIEKLLMLLVLSTIVTAIIANVTKEFSCKLCAFLTSMLVYIITYDISFIYRLCETNKTIKGKLTEILVWTLYAQILLVIFIAAINFLTERMGFGDKFAILLSICGICWLFNVTQKIEHMETKILRIYKSIQREMTNPCSYRLMY